MEKGGLDFIHEARWNLCVSDAADYPLTGLQPWEQNNNRDCHDINKTYFQQTVTYLHGNVLIEGKLLHICYFTFKYII